VTAAGGTERGFTSVAIKGSFWTAVQTIVNKLAAAGATVALGYLLEPSDFGLAWFALSAALLVSLFHVVAFGDVLLAYPSQFRRLAGPIRRLALVAALFQATVIIGAAFVLSRAYPDRDGLVGVMGVAACRPLMDALSVVSLAGMRLRLDYRRLSAIDAFTALFASASVVAMAAAGAGPYAIVVPPIMLSGVRAVAYRRAFGPAPAPPVLRRGRTALLFRLGMSAVGSYLAGILFLLETLVLGLFVNDHSLGLYSFAFGLASQVNSIVSFQIAGALQPIFGHLGRDPVRQVDGLVRSGRIIALVLVPLLLVQAAVGGAFIRVVWPGKWDDAVLIFQVISVGQALYVCQWPSAFLLKSQGRFRGYLKLQAVNIAVACVAFAVAAAVGGPPVTALASMAGVSLAADAATPMAVACTAVTLLAVFGPAVLKLAGKPGGMRWRTAFELLARPWLFGIPAAAAGLWLSTQVVGADGGMGAKVALLVLVGGCCGLLGVAAGIASSPSARADVRPMVAMATSRLGRRQS